VKDLIIDILKIVAPVSVALIVFAEGLGIAPGQVLGYWKERPALMLRSLVGMLVLVPAAALALILLLKPSPGVAIGLAILVACPPAPLMLKAAPKKGAANAALMATLHLTLAALAFVTVPTVLSLISRPLGFEADVDLVAMGWILARTILLPIAIGLAVRGLFPAAADRLAPVLGKAGTIGLGVVVLFAIAAFNPALLAMDLWSYAVMVMVSLVALVIGHFIGSDNADERTTLAVECAVRHPMLALTIAGMNFGAKNVLPMLLPCVITFIAIAMIYMAVRGKRAATSTLQAP
jgi:BASS family bile acid:Na+ symporter